VPIVQNAMRIFALFTVLGLAAGLAAPLSAQSLADVAKREAERRKVVKGEAKVYTNGDLPPAPSSQADPLQSAASDTTGAKKETDAKADAKSDGKAGDKGGEKTPAKDASAPATADVKDQAYWSSRMRTLNDQLERDRLYAEALQTRINSLTADFSAHDDPAQRALIGTDRDKALSELERLRKQIQDDKDAIGDAEDEARHAGVPPGWLR
jgi:hypothetical protein